MHNMFFTYDEREAGTNTSLYSLDNVISIISDVVNEIEQWDKVFDDVNNSNMCTGREHFARSLNNCILYQKSPYKDQRTNYKS